MNTSPIQQDKSHKPWRPFAIWMWSATILFAVMSVNYYHAKGHEFLSGNKKLIAKLLLSEQEVQTQKWIYLLTETYLIPYGLVTIVCFGLASNELCQLLKDK